jgi:CDP-paratose 2-epimerase
MAQGHEVIVYDNLSRPGAEANINWLREQYGGNWLFILGDIRDYDQMAGAIQGADVVLHLASQVAVTTSVAKPREDFEINALGTFNVLESVRHNCPKAAVLYASTNKVYGGMEGVGVAEDSNRYRYTDFVHGIPENFPLDFHSPYGCSKGAGDQYTIDYARIYGLRTVSLRQSCIYGRRQFGVEDQGWVAHFVIAACLGRPITIYGDGKQVRDILHVSDLIQAYELAIRKIDEIKGQAINLGGGPENTITIWSEFEPLLTELVGAPVPVSWAGWRPGDQRVFVANIQRAWERLSWKPKIGPEDGIRDLYDWVSTNSELFQTPVTTRGT